MSKVKNLAFDAALGARIRDARNAAGVPQITLGQALGVSFQQIQKYEKGQDRVSVEALVKIAATVGVEPQSFLDADLIALAQGGPGPVAPRSASLAA